MEVACGKCGAQRRVSDEQLAAGPLTLRCAACQSPVRAAAAPRAWSGSTRVDAWYMDGGQGAQGPYRIDELVALWRSDRISWNAKLWREGDPEWSPARGHGAFIDAIFAHDERARTTAALRADRPPLPPLPSSRVASAGSLPRDNTTPSFAANALASGSAASQADRTPHDSLAPFERASHMPGKRWPFAILLASGAVAVGVVVVAVRMQAPAEPQRSAAAALVPAQEQRATAVPPAAVAEQARLVPPAATAAATAAPALDANPAAAAAASAPRAAVAEAALDPAAGTAPARSAGRASETVSAPRPNAAASLAQEHAAAREVALDEGAGDERPVDSADEAVAPIAAPAARTGAPDFLTQAEPLPDLPTTREIASAVRAVAPAVRACAGSIAPTTVYVSVAIKGATGRVSRVRVPSVSSELQRCITDAVRNADFPHFERPELELRFPFLVGG
jgi:hypothetical protein